MSLQKLAEYIKFITISIPSDQTIFDQKVSPVHVSCFMSMRLKNIETNEQIFLITYTLV